MRSSGDAPQSKNQLNYPLVWPGHLSSTESCRESLCYYDHANTLMVDAELKIKNLLIASLKYKPVLNLEALILGSY